MDDDLDSDPMETPDKSSEFWIDSPDHLGNRGNEQSIYAYSSELNRFLAQQLSKLMINALGDAANCR